MLNEIWVVLKDWYTEKDDGADYHYAHGNDEFIGVFKTYEDALDRIDILESKDQELCKGGQLKFEAYHRQSGYLDKNEWMYNVGWNLVNTGAIKMDFDTHSVDYYIYLVKIGEVFKK